jgi:hypothetical protein
MKKSNNKLSKDWSPEQKLDAIAKTFSMNEEELSAKGRPKPKLDLDLEVVALRKEKFYLN